MPVGSAGYLIITLAKLNNAYIIEDDLTLSGSCLIDPGTPFTVSVDAREGITTGVSARDRARTIRTMVADDAGPDDRIANFWVDDLSYTVIPEPGTMTLLGMGILGLVVFGWRRRR